MRYNVHGEPVEYISLDKNRFNEIYDRITGMMNKFVSQVSNAVILKDYLL